MKLEEIEPGKLYHISFQYSSDSFFDGIVKAIRNEKDELEDDDYVYCEIVAFNKSSSWKLYHEFYIQPEKVNKEVSEQDDPEYFI